MDREKEIEQIQFIALNAVGKKYNSVEMMKANYCGKGDKGFYEESKALVEAGYHKTIWHKVTENDLPKRQGQKVWLCTISKDYFMANYWDDTEVGGKQFFEVASAGRITLSNVLAWTELPTYEE